jgi:hypothetical protein
MSDIPEERDPLSVPVRDATPEQLELQAVYHANNAALSGLQEFLADTDHEDLGIEPYEAGILGEGPSESHLRVLVLHELKEEEGAIVFFHDTGKHRRSYGVLNVARDTIEPMSIVIMAVRYGAETIRRTNGKLRELLDAYDLGEAFRRLDDDPTR